MWPTKLDSQRRDGLGHEGWALCLSSDCVMDLEAVVAVTCYIDQYCLKGPLILFRTVLRVSQELAFCLQSHNDNAVNDTFNT